MTKKSVTLTLVHRRKRWAEKIALETVYRERGMSRPKNQTFSEFLKEHKATARVDKTTPQLRAHLKKLGYAGRQLKQALGGAVDGRGMDINRIYKVTVAKRTKRNGRSKKK